MAAGGLHGHIHLVPLLARRGTSIEMRPPMGGVRMVRSGCGLAIECASIGLPACLRKKPCVPVGAVFSHSWPVDLDSTLEMASARFFRYARDARNHNPCLVHRIEVHGSRARAVGRAEHLGRFAFSISRCRSRPLSRGVSRAISAGDLGGLENRNADNVVSSARGRVVSAMAEWPFRTDRLLRIQKGASASRYPSHIPKQ